MLLSDCVSWMVVLDWAVACWCTQLVNGRVQTRTWWSWSPDLYCFFHKASVLSFGLLCKTTLSGKVKDALEKWCIGEKLKRVQGCLIWRKDVGCRGYIPAIRKQPALVLCPCKLHLVHWLICKTPLLIKWVVSVHWLNAVDKLFSLFVETTLENKHCYPILQMRKTESLYHTICSGSHGYFVTELGFRSVLSQSEPCALSYLCCADAQMRSMALFGTKAGFQIQEGLLHTAPHSRNGVVSRRKKNSEAAFQWGNSSSWKLVAVRPSWCTD